MSITRRALLQSLAGMAALVGLGKSGQPPMPPSSRNALPVLPLAPGSVATYIVPAGCTRMRVIQVHPFTTISYSVGS